MPLLIVLFYAGYHVIAVDMPGHGRSQHMPAFCHYSAEAYIRICAALLSQPRPFEVLCNCEDQIVSTHSCRFSLSGTPDFPPQILLIGHR